MRSSPATVVLVLFAACTTADPSAAAYEATLRPLFRANSQLAISVINLAADAHDKRVDVGAVQSRWRTAIVPSSEHIAWQAAVADVPEDWTETHDQLVAIWGQRAAAYRDLDFAIRDARREAWTQAGESVNESQVAEEAWVAEVVKILDSRGVRLDPYPTTGCCLTP